MKRWLVRIVGGFALLIVLIAAGVWLLLAAPFFSEIRRDVVERVLSDQIGQPLHVHDDVRVALGPVSHIYVGGVVIPSPTIDDMALAELNLLELELDLIGLTQGRLHFDNLKVDGLQANFVMLEDGTTSWRQNRQATVSQTADSEPDNASETMPEASSTDEDIADGSGILEFLRDKNASFTSIGLVVDNRVSGFSFDFDLETFALDQVDGGQRSTITGVGSVNGQDFEIAGDYPRDQQFTTHASFGEMQISFDGTPYPEAEGGGFRGDFAMDTGAFGDFLDVIGLERVLEGSGQMSATIDAREALAVEDFSAVVQLDEGQELKAEGAIEDMRTVEGFDFSLEARLHPAGKPPPVAKSIGDLKLSGLEMQIVGSSRKFELEKLLFRTNAFDQGLDVIGPAGFENIRRMPDGRLAMLGITLQAGPVEDPILQARGEILDLLQLEDITVEGKLAGPAKLLLTDMEDAFVDQFGGIEAEFALTNAGGPLALTKFEAASYGTDLWTFDMNLAVTELKELAGLDLDLSFDVLDGGLFLTALNLEPVDVGALGVDASTTRKGEEFAASVDFTAGDSNLAAALDATFPEGAPILRGDITSEKLDLGDLKNLTASLKQLQTLLGDGNGAKEPEVQPLVLPKESDDPDVQPLVLPKEKGKPSDLLNIEKLLTEADVEVAIDFKEISGAKGVSAVSSALSAKEGTVTFGPLDLAYGGGNFSLSASMDLVDAPETIALSGATSGWDFGEILDEIGLGIDAYGPLSGEFSITGNISSGAAFMKTMRGNAYIAMSKGAIATSLLELAGLGIFPWLFSEEFRQGYTDITCVVAPVRLDPGRASFDRVVVETGAVQLVAAGQVDWGNDSIAIRAEPRRVGKPLARSAWPFDVTGKLSEPKFKLDIGGSRSRRSDGADEMPANRRPCVPDILQLQ